MDNSLNSSIQPPALPAQGLAKGEVKDYDSGDLVDNPVPRDWTPSLLFGFAIIMLAVSVGYATITAVFQVTSQAQVGSDIKAIVQATLERNSVKVLKNLDQHRFNLGQLELMVRNSPYSPLNITSPTDFYNFSFVWPKFQLALHDFPYLVFAYEDWDSGIPVLNATGRPLGSPDTIWRDSSCGKGFCTTWFNETMFNIYHKNEGLRPEDFQDVAPDVQNSAEVTTSTWVISGSKMHISNASRTQWTLVYPYFETTGGGGSTVTSGYFLLTLQTCISYHPVTGYCGHLLLMDINLHSIQTEVPTIGTTNVSIVALIDARDLTVLATNSELIPFVPDLDAMKAARDPRIADAIEVCTRAAVERFGPGAYWNHAIAAKSGSFIIGCSFVDGGDGLALILLDITPREFYYESIDRSLRISIAVLVVAVAVTLALCVVMFLGIQLPITVLMENFEKASMLRNEDVISVSPWVREIKVLSDHFHIMNDRMTVAKAYLPQSMLDGIRPRINSEGLEEQEAEEDDEFDDEGSLESTPTVTSMPTPRAATADMQASVVAQGENRESSLNQKSPNLSSSMNRKSIARKAKHHSALDIVMQCARVLGGSHMPPLQERKASIVVIRVHELQACHDLILKTPFELQRCQQLHNDWLHMAQDATRVEKGVVESVIGDRVVLTFNCSKVCGGHVAHAVRCALLIQDKCRRHHSLRKSPYAAMSMGLSSGPVLTGPVGTVMTRSFTTFGKAVTEAFLLEQRGKHFLNTVATHAQRSASTLQHQEQQDAGVSLTGSTSINNRKEVNISALIVKGSLVEEISTEFYHFSIDNFGVVAGDGKPQYCDVVACPIRKGPSDEWMYEMQKTESENPFSQVGRLVRVMLTLQGGKNAPTDAVTALHADYLRVLKALDEAFLGNASDDNDDTEACRNAIEMGKACLDSFFASTAS